MGLSFLLLAVLGLMPGSPEWICAADAPVRDETSSPQRAADGTSWFAGEFTVERPVRRAVWHVSGLGVFEIYVNGVRVGGEDALKPGYTSARTKYYYSYDVTDRLNRQAGSRNVLTAEVSSGWWRDKVVGFVGKRSAFCGALELIDEKGGRTWFSTDASRWRAAGDAGPVRHAGIYDGEEYDARIVSPRRGEGVVGKPARCEEFDGDLLPVQGARVVRRRDLAIARGPFDLKKGDTLVVDFGQNCAAVPEFRFRAKRGTALTALPGEMLNDDDAPARGCDGPKGSVYRANLRCPNEGMRIRYVFSGDGPEMYLPRFTYFGYRYLSLRASEDVRIESVTSIPVSSVTKEMELGAVETGDESINRLISNIRWGMLSNYLSVPTDCPQRNERHGWTADAQVFAEAGTFLADTESFFRKWMRDLRDGQKPTGGFTPIAPNPHCSMRFGWSDAGVIVPFIVWKQFGCEEIVRENWAAMARFVAHVDETRYEFKRIAAECANWQYADWLSFEKYESASGGGYAKGPDGKPRLIPEAEAYWNYLGGCYWLLDARLMSRMAKVAGADPTHYDDMADRAARYLKDRFLSREDGLLVESFRDMQTPALFALYLGLVEGDARKETISRLRANFRAHGGCLQTGFLGTSILMDALTECGMAGEAYDLLLSHDFPGWLYSVDQGATTVWERWNSYTRERGFGPVDMNSFNHYAYGAVLSWIFKTAAGIAADLSAPGFAVVAMTPVPDRRLGFVRATYRSRAGLVRSAWRYEGNSWVWEFSVPPGARAVVTLPGEEKSRTYESGDHRIVKELK